MPLARHHQKVKMEDLFISEKKAFNTPDGSTASDTCDNLKMFRFTIVQ
jgi:hypothetical protein